MTLTPRNAAEKTAQPVDNGTLHSLLVEGLQLQKAGRLVEAERLYRQVLDARPENVDALALLGVIALQTDRLDLAADLLGKAIEIDPSDSVRHFNLASVLRKQGRLAEAAESYRKAIARDPVQAQYYVNLGSVLNDLDQADEAIRAYRTALRLRPELTEAHYNLGNALRGARRFEEAAGAYRDALAFRPDYPEALHNLGVALGELKRYSEALPHLRRALALRDRYAEAHNTLGVALEALDQPDEAIEHYRAALAENPDFAEAHNNLGTVLNRLGRVDDAADSFRSALALKPGFAQARVNYGQVRIGQGEVAEGWRHYEARWETPEFVRAHRSFGQPRWRGEPGAGRTLLIHAEQGLGDTIQFCRYVAATKNRGLKVVLEVQAPLARLLESLAGAEQVFAQGDFLMPAFELQIPMMSLPATLDLPILPMTEPYLHAVPAEAAAWGARLQEQAIQPLKVGIIWAGNPSLDADARRSISIDRLAPLWNTPGVTFFNLQKGRPHPSDSPMIDFTSDLKDFADTAALVANLDLVITVDTAMAHLAGAMGKPVWLLNRFDGCWRWMSERTDSPWYPSMKLYRQPGPDRWEPVVEAIAQDLKTLAISAGHAASH